LIAEADAAGNVVKSYGYRPGSTWTTDPLFMKEGSNYYFYTNDHLGTPQKLTAVNGAVVWSVKYSSFGKATVEVETVENSLRFSGQYYDRETGLHYNYNRYFSFEVGRFLRTDPLGFKAGVNIYSYVLNNPVNLKDPYGLDAIPIVFPDYKISTPVGKIGGLGHAGILLIDPKTGLTKYYEYGRYRADNDECNCGIVRKRTIPNVVMGKDGRPTPESLNKVLSSISNQSGQGGRISGAYIKNDKFAEMNNYAVKKKAQNRNPKREHYSLSSNNCAHFMKDVLEAGEVDPPWIIDPRPNSYIEELRDDYPKIDYP